MNVLEKSNSELSKADKAKMMAFRLELVAQVFDVRLTDVMSSERGCDLVVAARSAAYFLLGQLAEHAEIGRIIGGRTGRAVSQAVNKVPARRRREEWFAGKLDLITLQLGKIEKGVKK